MNEHDSAVQALSDAVEAILEEVSRDLAKEIAAIGPPVIEQRVRADGVHYLQCITPSGVWVAPYGAPPPQQDPLPWVRKPVWWKP